MVTALPGNEESPAIKGVPIAALTFCCNDKNNGAYFISLFAVSGDDYTKKEYGNGSDGLTWRGRQLGSFLLDLSARTYSSIVHDKSSPISAFTIVHTDNDFITKSLSLLEFYPYSFDHASLYHEYVWMEEDDVTDSNVLPYCSAGRVYCKKCKFIVPKVVSVSKCEFNTYLF